MGCCVSIKKVDSLSSIQTDLNRQKELNKKVNKELNDAKHKDSLEIKLLLLGTGMNIIFCIV